MNDSQTPDSDAYSPQAHIDDDDDQLQQGVGDNDDDSASDDFDHFQAEYLSAFHSVYGDALPGMPTCHTLYPLVTPRQNNHTVLYNTSFTIDKPPKPYPSERTSSGDVWSSEYVRSPYSPHSVYPVYSTSHDASSSPEVMPRSEIIRDNLLKPITNTQALVDAIMSYNHRFKGKWRFNVLHAFINEMLDSERNIFFNKLLPKVIELAINYEDLCTQSIPLLRCGSSASISMSQLQAASILANALLCTYPRRNTNKPGSEYDKYPKINFNALYSGNNQREISRKIEKLKCIFHYFRRVTSKAPEGTLTFTRRSLSPNDLPNWGESQKRLHLMKVSHSGLIESEDNAGFLQVDFANKFIGGGVLGGGLVQEEIRFMISPEMIVSRLFTERLADNECMIITGCELYSKYTGYSDTFQWAGNHQDTTACDTFRRRYSQLLAIDAIHFYQAAQQYQPIKLIREINKAYCGFYQPDICSSDKPSAIATGNWGCGAFNGDPQVKALLQLMSSSEADRLLVYHTFNSKQLARDLINISSHLHRIKSTVGKLWQLVESYHRGSDGEESLFDYIYRLTADG